MKRILFLAVLTSLFAACTVYIPTCTSISNQTLLLTENRNIKANYTLLSEKKDGPILYIEVQKRGAEFPNYDDYIYASESAFKKMWGDFFSTKFNPFATDEINITVTLKDIKLKELADVSLATQILADYYRGNVEAYATFGIAVEYHGKKYEKQYEVSSTAFNESLGVTDYYYGYYMVMEKENPTQLKARVLEECLNNSLVQFELFLRQVVAASK